MSVSIYINDYIGECSKKKLECVAAPHNWHSAQIPLFDKLEKITEHLAEGPKGVVNYTITLTAVDELYLSWYNL
jgi:hypothetical protein